MEHFALQQVTAHLTWMEQDQSLDCKKEDMSGRKDEDRPNDGLNRAVQPVFLVDSIFGPRAVD